jgi:hypothetical protein
VKNGSNTSQSGESRSQSEDKVDFLMYVEDSDESG